MSIVPTPCPANVPTTMPMPKFLDYVSPVGTITRAKYEQSLTDPLFKGIRMRLSAAGLADSILESQDLGYRRNTISDRVTLSVDGLLIRNDKNTIFDELLMSGPFSFSWAVKLNTGYHTAKLVFDLESGEIINYHWTFCIAP